MKRINWDWLGGFFDGEGSITIQRKPHLRILIRMTQEAGERKLLESIVKFLRKEGITSSIAEYKEGKTLNLQIAGIRNAQRFAKKIVQRLNTEKYKRKTTELLQLIEIHQYLKKNKAARKKQRNTR